METDNKDRIGIFLYLSSQYHAWSSVARDFAFLRADKIEDKYRLKRKEKIKVVRRYFIK